MAALWAKQKPKLTVSCIAFILIIVSLIGSFYIRSHLSILQVTRDGVNNDRDEILKEVIYSQREVIHSQREVIHSQRDEGNDGAAQKVGTKNGRQDFHKVRWPDGDTAGGTVGLFYHHQNPPVTDCDQKKFLVFEMPKKKGDGHTRNIGSLYSSMIMWLSWCQLNGRILVLDDRDWQLAECSTHNTECYFKPISTCKLSHAISDESQVLRIKDMNSLKTISEKTIVVPPRVHAWFPIHNEQFTFKIGWFHPCHRLRAALLYVWRPQPWLVDVLEDNLRAAIPPWFNPKTALGMPVRASDKCHGHDLHHSAGGELHCLTFEVLMKAARDVRDMYPQIDTLVFTTEDPKLVVEVKSWNDKQPADRKWKMVYNVRDVMQGTGSASAITVATSGVTSKQKIMESALTSLHLQLRPRHLLYRFYTSWNLMARLLHDSDQVTFAEDRLKFAYDHLSGKPSAANFINYRC